MVNSTTVNPLLLMNLIEVPYPVVGMKTYSLSTFELIPP
jgi:hypothetical protein